MGDRRGNFLISGFTAYKLAESVKALTYEGQVLIVTFSADCRIRAIIFSHSRFLIANVDMKKVHRRSQRNCLVGNVVFDS